MNLATYLLLDAFRRDCEMAVIVSNDSDLREPVRIVKEEFDIPVGLLNPHRRKASRALVNLRPAFVKPIRQSYLSASQFPDKISDSHGEVTNPNGGSTRKKL